MPRPVLLFTGPWADVPLEVLAGKAAEWGYDGLELCSWGDHLEIQRGLAEDAYAPARLDLLARYNLQLMAVAAHKVSQAVSDSIAEHHQALLPDYVWGDGKPDGVRERASAELAATFKLAEKLGVGVVTGFTGSRVWHYTSGYPAPKPGIIARALKQFADEWHPLLDTAAECGVRFACEVHPGQLAFDLYSTEAVLDALGGRDEFGLLFDPAHLLWQGIDPMAFLRRFADRVYHVHVRDAVLNLDGRASLLAGYWPSGDARRGWQFRTPGRGGVDWEAVIRTLNDTGYDGPLSVDWHDPGMDRDYGAAEACRFVKQLDFDPPATGPRPYRGN